MNLYSIDFQHWSQKDSKKGIKGFVLAPDDEAVLDWFLANDKLNGLEVWAGMHWKDGLSDGDIKRKRLLKKRGQLYDKKKYENITDRYYGVTLYGWSLVTENVSDVEAAVLMKTGCAVQA